MATSAHLAWAFGCFTLRHLNEIPYCIALANLDALRTTIQDGNDCPSIFAQSSEWLDTKLSILENLVRLFRESIDWPSRKVSYVLACVAKWLPFAKFGGNLLFCPRTHVIMWWIPMDWIEQFFLHFFRRWVVDLSTPTSFLLSQAIYHLPLHLSRKSDSPVLT